MITFLQIACTRYEITPSVVEEPIVDPNCNTTTEELQNVMLNWVYIRDNSEVLLSDIYDFVDGMIDVSNEQNDYGEDSDVRIEIMYDEGSTPIIISYDDTLKHYIKL